MERVSFSVTLNNTRYFINNRFGKLLFIAVLIAILKTLINPSLFFEDNIFFYDLIVAYNDYLYSQNVFPSQIILVLIKYAFLKIILPSTPTVIFIAGIYNLSIQNKFNFKIFLSKFASSFINILVFYFIIFVISALVFFIVSISGFPLAKDFLEPTVGFYCLFYLLTMIFTAISLFFYGIQAGPKMKLFKQLILSYKLSIRYWLQTILFVIFELSYLFLISKFQDNISNDNIVFKKYIINFATFYYEIIIICYFYRLYALDKMANSNKADIELNNTELPI
ncbi:hypothetical protein RCS94_04060 [Orbaceae bacterium ac157xtp]